MVVNKQDTETRQ